ncbi:MULTISPECIES: hypothetical protein [unclassified Sphingomonas]|uniref:hypothetical protein n=1 Tax=unclassified Sphingomonas TaxID=196159 RepID=UPI002867158C|nr:MULTISPECIES: hypothetical protein [unclassified Sphingomonas]MDR6115800.1 hypothetical protein [Sphingomonas sp. SORGH_AS_0789]MDR6150529.1 hypothetical protein [Sphingomonas sp. SORGH_AS_0742]
MGFAALHPQETAGVLFTFDTHVPEIYSGSVEAEAFPIHCARGSDGWANVLDVTLVDPGLADREGRVRYVGRGRAGDRERAILRRPQFLGTASSSN